MKSKKKHSVKKGLELKELKRCHYERDGKCDCCSSARGKLGWDPCLGTHDWDPLLGPTLLGPTLGTHDLGPTLAGTHDLGPMTWDPRSGTHNL